MLVTSASLASISNSFAKPIPNFAGALQIPRDYISESVSADDPRIIRYMKKFAAAKRKHKAEVRPPAKEWDQPLAAAENWGRRLAASKGDQYLLLGENHAQLKQWEILGKIIKTYLSAKSADDARPIILVNEEEENYFSVFSDWNQGKAQKPGLLGDKFAKAHYTHYSNANALAKALMKDLKNGKGNSSYISQIPFAPFLNYISALVPNVKVFNIDANAGMDDPVPPSRDLVMAANIDILKEMYPNAIFIGSFGADHVVEYYKDNPKTVSKGEVDAMGVDMNDLFAERLSIMYGDKVHTLRVATAQAWQKGDAKLYDEMVRITPYQSSGVWFNPWTKQQISAN